MRYLFLCFVFMLKFNSSVFSQPFELELIGTGFIKPVDISSTGSKDDTRLFITEKDGKIRILHQDGMINELPFLNIDPKVNSQANERGLLGLCFHPDYENNGYFFVNYSNNNGNTTISRFKVLDTNPDIADPNSEKILLVINQPFNNHNAGDINFGPDGYLYIGTGDGGNGGDPGNRSQNPKELLGKMLRIDVDTESLPYLIPNDNPYANNTDTLPEIWALGLRNPWRFSFDTVENNMWIADVGQDKWEEVNAVNADLPAVNYGWRCYEGLEKFNYNGCNDAVNYQIPVHTYANKFDIGCSITGGYVYRGSANPSLTGKYIYTDFCTGIFWAISQDESGNWSNEELADLENMDYSTFGIDYKNELYVGGLSSGNIYRINNNETVCDAASNCKDVKFLQVDADQQTCVDACNSGVNSSGTCDPEGHPTYYAFVIDHHLTDSVIISITGASFTPSISIGPDCINSYIDCFVGTISNVVKPTTDTIYVKVEAVSGLNLDEAFQVCINAYSKPQLTNCYEANLIASRPEHPEEDQNGPYYPGERLNFCYEVDFNVSLSLVGPPEGNNCQWLQGIVPVAKEGWDLEALPLSDQTGPQEAQWLAEGSVHYNFSSPQYYSYQLENGSLAIGYGQAGLNEGGDMPAGWYFASPGNGESCTDANNPDYAYGLPAECGTIQKVKVCFDLKVKDFSTIESCESTKLQLDMFSFSDGELGCTNNLSCGGGIPLSWEGMIDCEAISSVQPTKSGFDILTIKPNPVSKILEINLNSASSKSTTFIIFDSFGRENKRITSSSKEAIHLLDVSELLPGTYYLGVEGKSSYAGHSKFIKI